MHRTAPRENVVRTPEIFVEGLKTYYGFHALGFGVHDEGDDQSCERSCRCQQSQRRIKGLLTIKTQHFGKNENENLYYHKNG